MADHPDETPAQSTHQVRLVLTIDGNALSEEFDGSPDDLVALSRDFSADNISISTGHQYTGIDDRCPACETKLELTRVQPDTENGAHAPARCPDDDCEWVGTAVYRLIDLESETGESHESAVSSGDITPNYRSY